MKNRILSLLFGGLLLAGAVLGLLLPDRYYSANERRTLQQLPKLTWNRLLSGRFGSELETYLADQFPGRDGWVAVKTLTERLTGRPDSGGVSFAADGYLIELHAALNETRLRTNLEAIARLSAALAEQGVPLRFLPAPTAAWTLRDRLPTHTPNADQRVALEIAEALGIETVDVFAALEAHSEAYIYYKTDHHWTTLGAYYAWAAWREALGETPAAPETWTRETLTDRFRGTTWAKVNDPLAAWDSIEAWYRDPNRPVRYNGGVSAADSIYARKYLEGSDPYGVFFNSNQADAAARGTGSGRLLIVKDSYANCFAQLCLEDYEEVHLIDPRFFRGSVEAYVIEHGITEVLVLYNVPNLAEDTALARLR